MRPFFLRHALYAGSFAFGGGSLREITFTLQSSLRIRSSAIRGVEPSVALVSKKLYAQAIAVLVFNGMVTRQTWVLG